MPGRKHSDDSRFDSIPLAGVLYLVCGVGLVVAYFKYYEFIEDWSVFQRGLFFGSACLLALHGLQKVLGAVFASTAPFSGQRRRRPARTRKTAGARRHRFPDDGDAASETAGDAALDAAGSHRDAAGELTSSIPESAPLFRQGRSALGELLRSRRARWSIVGLVNLLFGVCVAPVLIFIGMAYVVSGSPFGLIILAMALVAGLQVPASVAWLRRRSTGLANSATLARLFLVPIAAIIGLLISEALFRGRPVEWGVLVGYAALGVWPAFLVAYAAVNRRVERQLLQRARPYRALPQAGTVFLFVVMPVMLIGSLLGRSNQLMLIFSLMAGAFIINGWFIFTMMQRMRVGRRVPEEAVAGEPFSVDIIVENAKRWFSGTMMTATDQLENEHESLRAHVHFYRIPPRAARTGTYRLRLMQRGVYRFGPVRVTTRFPLGLVERGLIFERDDEVLVFPRIGRLTPAWTQRRSQRAELVARADPCRGAFHDEFHAIREYRPGDNPRDIHWRTSARQNELMVREFHQTRLQDLVVLLDLWQPPRPTDADRERVELAISFAATVCVHQMKETRESRIEVCVAGRRLTQWKGRTGAAGIESLLRILALASADSAPNLEALIQKSASSRSANVRVLLLTTRKRTGELRDAMLQNGQGTPSGSGGEAEIIAVNDRTLRPYFVLE